MSMLQRTTTQLRKRARRYLAKPALQHAYRLMYRLSLAGMNYGGAGSMWSAGDELALAQLAHLGGPRVIFDVGANVGVYVELALRLLGDVATVYAFEPSPRAFAELKDGYAATRNVHLIPCGVAARTGQATLFAAKPGSVLGSMYVNPTYEGLAEETIQLVTIDEFCAELDIRRIDLLKLDVEGGEHEALLGARRMLEAGAIERVQFEFGQPSLGARTFFSDLYRLLAPSYNLFRVLPGGLEPLTAYHETLEVFMSTNYLAIRR
jgi:FkbM family methyltransferase